MKKVILNKCYGGYGVSLEAYALYAQKKGLTLYWYYDEDDVGKLKYVGDKPLYKTNEHYYGNEKQMLVCVEEMAELTKEILKLVNMFVFRWIKIVKMCLNLKKWHEWHETARLARLTQRF